MVSLKSMKMKFIKINHFCSYAELSLFEFDYKCLMQLIKTFVEGKWKMLYFNSFFVVLFVFEKYLLPADTT